MFGFGVGVVGLRPDDFFKLSLDEFNDICNAFKKYNSSGEEEQESILNIEDLDEQLADIKYWRG